MSQSDQEAILLTLEASREKLTPGRLILRASRETGAPRADLKAALRSLIDQGTLTYAQCFGSTVVEISFARPIQITPHFVLSPPGPWESASVSNAGLTRDMGPQPPSGTTLIIEPGISFGSGSHPTTRLCLRAIDHLLFNTTVLYDLQPIIAADIGTGSGVLAIAAMKHLNGTCAAVDTDPNCVAEARRNVVRNGLAHRISVLQSMFEPDPRESCISLILANLRFPTLKTLAPVFSRSTCPGAILVISGFRPRETRNLLQAYTQLDFECIRHEAENGWEGVILRKNSGQGPVE